MTLRWVELLCWLRASGPNSDLTGITIQDLEFCPSDWPRGGVSAGGPQTPTWSPRFRSTVSSMAITSAAEVDSLPEQLPVQQTRSIKEPQHAEEPILCNISIPFPLKQWLSTWAATGMTWGAWNLPGLRTHLRPVASTSRRVRPRRLDVSKLPRGDASWQSEPSLAAQSEPLSGVVGVNRSPASCWPFCYCPPACGACSPSELGNSAHSPICRGPCLQAYLCSRRWHPLCPLLGYGSQSVFYTNSMGDTNRCYGKMENECIFYITVVWVKVNQICLL